MNTLTTILLSIYGVSIIGAFIGYLIRYRYSDLADEMGTSSYLFTGFLVCLIPVVNTVLAFMTIFLSGGVTRLPREHDKVVACKLINAHIMEEVVYPGTPGVIVHVYNNNAYEVEFTLSDGSKRVETVNRFDFLIVN